MTERWTDETLDRFASTVATGIQANNEAIAANAQAIADSNERLTRIEQLVESNNRFLESFGQDVKQLTQNMSQLTQQMSSTIANSNQDRMDVTTRLSAINRKVDAIASHLGVIQ
jgi:chromosome segregation ATPase